MFLTTLRSLIFPFSLLICSSHEATRRTRRLVETILAADRVSVTRANGHGCESRHRAPGQVIANKQNAEAWGAMFKGLKTDSEYDPTNGYKPLKPVP